jgi:hypothetical protein
LHSIDGENYSEMITLAGAGTTSINSSYNAVHADPLPEINYYKLIQVDYDGKATAYGPISIDNRAQKRNLIRITNMMGQAVGDDYTGIVIYHYDDGTYEKIYK